MRGSLQAYKKSISRQPAERGFSAQSHSNAYGWCN